MVNVTFLYQELLEHKGCKCEGPLPFWCEPMIVPTPPHFIIFLRLRYIRNQIVRLRIKMVVICLRLSLTFVHITQILIQLNFTCTTTHFFYDVFPMSSLLVYSLPPIWLKQEIAHCLIPFALFLKEKTSSTNPRRENFIH